MKEYLKLLIVLVSFISVAIIILPNGRMKKTTCICFSFLICLTLLSPIKGFIGDFVIEEEQSEYDYSQENDYRQGIYVYAIKKILIKNEIAVKDVSLQFDENNMQNLKIIGIKLDDSVLKDEEQHINIIVKAKECLSEELNISFSEIVIYE